MNLKKSNDKAGFTIIELLTVMSIIVVLISILVPALNRVKRYARDVRQRAQFHAIGIALEQFAAEHDGYPPSTWDTPAAPQYGYCGAMKLAEAMVGQDLRGFHPDSRFRSDGTLDGTVNTRLYHLSDPGVASPLYAYYIENTKSRQLYLQLENANPLRLFHLYDTAHLEDIGTGVWDPCSLVLTDVYNRVVNRETGKKAGMPILYYKADTTKNAHVASDDQTVLGNNIYNRLDNQTLVDLPLPWIAVTVVGRNHPMASTGATTPDGIASDPAIFYRKTRDPSIPAPYRPHRADSYILMSAGFDGEYGTPDDIFNFSSE